ncbi:1654_t:CDS:2, partial [Entrophospora sp. SA101]
MYKNFTNKKGTEYSGNVILGFDNLEVTNELLKDVDFQPFMIQINVMPFCAKAVNIDEDIKNIVQDNGFWEEVGDLFRILNQLVIGISIFESDTPCLSGVLDWYYDQLESSVEDHIKDILEKRWKSIYHPIMEVAHLLDPSFHGC